MSIELSFREHEQFHRAAMAMTVGGAAAGTIGGIAGAGPAGALFAGATGAILGAAWADRGAGLRRLGARAVLLGAAIGAFLAIGGNGGVAALAAIVGLALGLGSGRARVAWSVIAGGAIAYLGGFTAGQVMIARETASLPHVLEVALASTAMAMVSIAALLPRHLTVARDPIAAAASALPRGLDAEVKGLLERGTAVWRESAPRLDDDGKTLLRDAVLRLHDLAGRWAKVDRPAQPVATLEARKAELDAKIEASKDEVARTQYREARAAIDDQLGYVASIELSRERVIARLHACVATLEKYRLAAAQLDARGALMAEIAACGETMAQLPA